MLPLTVRSIAWTKLGFSGDDGGAMAEAEVEACGSAALKACRRPKVLRETLGILNKPEDVVELDIVEPVPRPVPRGVVGTRELLLTDMPCSSASGRRRRSTASINC